MKRIMNYTIYRLMIILQKFMSLNLLIQVPELLSLNFLLSRIRLLKLSINNFLTLPSSGSVTMTHFKTIW